VPLLNTNRAAAQVLQTPRNSVPDRTAIGHRWRTDYPTAFISAVSSFVRPMSRVICARRNSMNARVPGRRPVWTAKNRPDPRKTPSRWKISESFQMGKMLRMGPFPASFFSGVNNKIWRRRIESRVPRTPPPQPAPDAASRTRFPARALPVRFPPRLSSPPIACKWRKDQQHNPGRIPPSSDVWCPGIDDHIGARLPPTTCRPPRHL